MLIELKELSKAFLTSEIKTNALKEVSFSVEEGEFVSIMGPSGCGKSTLLNILGMLDSPTSGKYEFLGQDIAKFGESKLAKIRRSNVGFIFQSFNLIDQLSVKENIALPLYYQNLSKQEIRNRVEEIIERMELSNRRNHKPMQLSGGQQQRVAIARALITKPKFVLADEPTGNLDSDRGTEVMTLLKELNNSGTAIVMVTHSPEDANYGSRIIKLSDGKVLENLSHRSAA